jgi:hypothetical protein
MAMLRLTKAQLKQMTGPCVYEFRKGGRALYIGSSAHGVPRPLSRSHHRRLLREASDEVVIRFCDTYAEAKEIERQNVLTLRPIGNMAIPELEKAQGLVVRKARYHNDLCLVDRDTAGRYGKRGVPVDDAAIGARRHQG